MRRPPTGKQLTASVLCLAALLLQGCGPASLTTGVYRAAIETPLGDLPFYLEFIEDTGAWQASIVMGDERIAATDVSSAEGRVELRIARTKIEAALGRNSLTGDLRLMTDGRENTLPFSAAADTLHLYYERAATDNADIAGLWLIEQTPSALGGPITVEIRQLHDQLEVRSRTDANEGPLLLGQVRGEAFSFGRFDGDTAVLYTGTFDDSGRLVGEYWSATTGRGKWTAKHSDHGFFNPWRG